MSDRKEDTPQRIARRKYEETKRKERRLKSGNFSTLLPRKQYEEINAFLKEHHITKVDLIIRGYVSLREEVESIKK